MVNMINNLAPVSSFNGEQTMWLCFKFSSSFFIDKAFKTNKQKNTKKREIRAKKLKKH